MGTARTLLSREERAQSREVRGGGRGYVEEEGPRKELEYSPQAVRRRPLLVLFWLQQFERDAHGTWEAG